MDAFRAPAQSKSLVHVLGLALSTATMLEILIDVLHASEQGDILCEFEVGKMVCLCPWDAKGSLSYSLRITWSITSKQSSGDIVHFFLMLV